MAKKGPISKIDSELGKLLYLYKKVMGSLICKAKFPWAANYAVNMVLSTVTIYRSSGQSYLHGKISMGSQLHCPLSYPLFSYLEVVDCPLSYPLFPYMEVVGSLIYKATFPWAVMG